jgi:Ser/Thr protein kinase RdoA (MazF antagonist)
MVAVPLAIAADLYDVTEAQLTPLRGGHFNYVYGFTQDGGQYILRLTPPNDEMDVQACQSLLAWMAYLAARGASVPGPLPSKNGRLIEIIPTNEGDWQAVVFTQAQGVLSEELSLDQWDDRLFRNLGRTVGRMHSLAVDYVATGEHGFLPWEVSGNLFSDKVVASLATLGEKRARILQHLQTLPKDRENYGLIHADLHFGNFFVDFETGRITVIDFDDCALGWYVMDLAVLLFDVLVLYTGEERETFAANFMEQVLAGYTAEKSLDPFWLSQMPSFLKLLELNIYCEACKNNETGEGGGWLAKFMAGRRHRVENDVPYVNIDFERLLDSNHST